MTDIITSSKFNISLGFELTVIDTPNTLYGSVYDTKKSEQAILETLKRKKNRYFYIISTPKMRVESREFIQNLLNIKKDIKNFEFVFVEGNHDPDEEAIKLALKLKCPLISNDKFTQKKYDAYRNMNLEVWKFKINRKHNCISIYEKWKL